MYRLVNSLKWSRIVKLQSSILCLSLTLGVPFYSPVYAQTDTVNTYQIPAGELDAVLKAFALASGIEFHLDARLSEGFYSAGLDGQFTPEQGLNTLLTSTGLTAHRQADGSYQITDSTESLTLDTLDVSFSEEEISRDEAGKYAVYDDNRSTVYAGKKEVERYKGKDAADLFKGMPNVYSGDARNGGGIDPNIRGVQGPGRVPVLIDGTEQGLTVWRGYRGVSNRSYIDPNLIGGVQVIKGPNTVANVKTSTGGAVIVNTLSAQDILLPGKDFGGEFLIEGSNNAVAPTLGTLYTGQDYREVDGFPSTPQYPYADPSLWQPMSHNKNNNPFSGDDYAYRLALAKRGESMEWLAAYAYRYKGNYYGGKHDSGFYKSGDSKEAYMTKIDPETLALRHLPGAEIPNTSSETESVLLKSTFLFEGAQQLSLGARYTDAEYGEIMASRSGDLVDGNKMAQWPLSRVRAQAYNLDYHWSPKDPWIDLTAKLWTTYTVSDSNTRGGFPNYANNHDLLPGYSTLLRNTAASNAKDSRIGLNISNTMAFSDTLSITAAGRYQYREQRSDDTYDANKADGWVHFPQEGTYQEFDASLQATWQPHTQWTLNAGVKFQGFDVKDDFLAARQAEGGDTLFTQQAVSPGLEASYKVRVFLSEAEIQARLDRYRESLEFFGVPESQILVDLAEEEAKLREEGKIEERTQAWLHDGNGKYSRAQNPCDPANGLLPDNYIEGTCRATNQLNTKVNMRPKTHDHGQGWSPFASVAFSPTPQDRIYYRYSQMLRFPSLFESTLSFSALNNAYTSLKPEATVNHELGYIHHFTHGDLKLAYFHHLTENVIERDDMLRFSNIDSQTLAGLELQANYDDGDWFADLNGAYMLTNQVCDESSVVTRYRPDEPEYYRNCLFGGFPGGYLESQVPPAWSTSLKLGHRFLNRQLEAGIKGAYLAKAKSDEVVQRDDTLTFDAFANYQLSRHIALEVVGTNLTDVYHIDPLVRSSVPAPGRTIKLMLKAKF
ncbi:hypothetical protein BGL48_00870 [Salinivibrio sp. SS3]|nr:hypothetical protein BGL48_00870 [Salinivibrio sp. BNH]